MIRERERENAERIGTQNALYVTTDAILAIFISSPLIDTVLSINDYIKRKLLEGERENYEARRSTKNTNDTVLLTSPRTFLIRREKRYAHCVRIV